jgi:hypothetical protein
MKRTVKLTEKELKRMISESVRRTLNETRFTDFDDIRKNGWQEKLNQIGQLAMEMVEMAKDEAPNGFGERTCLEVADKIASICAKYGAAPNYKPYFY